MGLMLMLLLWILDASDDPVIRTTTFTEILKMIPQIIRQQAQKGFGITGFKKTTHREEHCEDTLLTSSSLHLKVDRVEEEKTEEKQIRFFSCIS